MYKNIYLDAPDLGDIEKRYLGKAIDSGYVSSVGPDISRFEKRFAKYLNVNGSVSMQSGTAAIHIALHALGINRNDEVIVPALTFIATVNPVVYVGAKPVFVDVDADTWNIDPDEIEGAITKKTKAIIPVHLYGNPCDMNRIIDIAKRYNLYVIEDATESLGARYRKRYTGTFGTLGCFSFNGNKVITTGGGGMVVGDNAEMLERIRFLINQARDEQEGYYHREIGFNYRMTNIEAALGLAQMKRLREFLLKKRKFNSIYREELGGLEYIRFQKEHKGAENSFWLSSAIFKDSIDISVLEKRLKARGVYTRRIFVPVVEFPPYKMYKNTAYKNAYHIYEKGLSLPSSVLNKEDDIYYVCKAIKEAV